MEPKNTFPALEEQIFEWEQWGEVGEPGSLQFADVTLKVDVGEFKAGTKFAAAFWSGSTGTVAFRTADEKTHIFRLAVAVGEKVDEKELFGEHDDSCGCGHDHCSN